MKTTDKVEETINVAVCVRGGYEEWIDIAKSFCIMGVVLQHVIGYCYTNNYIFYSVWWVVALFLMLGGYNTVNSYRVKGKFCLKKKLERLLIPYVFATFVYCVWKNRYFDMAEFLTRLLHFDACGPLYYVAVYIQLLMISPILIALIQWCEARSKQIRYFLIWIVILSFGAITANHTNVFDIALGGGNLFSGVWIFFWFAGMCIAQIKVREISRGFKMAVLMILTALLAIWQWVFVNKGYNLTLSSLSPSIRLTWANSLETLILFFWFKAVTAVMLDVWKDASRIIVVMLSFLGKHSLYIFMYHMLFLSVYQSYLARESIANAYVSYAFIILAPIVFEVCVMKAKKVMMALMKDIEIE